MTFRGHIKRTEMILEVFMRPHQKSDWLSNPDVVLGAQCARENSYKLILSNLLGSQVYDKRVCCLFAPLNINIVSSFYINWKDDELVFERFNPFFKVCYKFIDWSVKLKVALKTVCVIRHCEFVLGQINLSSLLKSKVGLSVSDHDSLFVFCKVKQTLLDVDLLFSLHVEHEISTGGFPVGTEVEIKENVMLLIINLFEIANLVLLKLLH